MPLRQIITHAAHTPFHLYGYLSQRQMSALFSSCTVLAVCAALYIAHSVLAALFEVSEHILKCHFRGRSLLFRLPDIRLASARSVIAALLERRTLLVALLLLSVVLNSLLDGKACLSCLIYAYDLNLDLLIFGKVFSDVADVCICYLGNMDHTRSAAVYIDECAILGNALDLACVNLTNLKLHINNKLLFKLPFRQC